MAYKDVLVHLDDSEGCAGRVEVAVRLAAQHGAHLTAVYPIVEIPLLYNIRDRIPRDVRATMDAEAQEHAETALQAFRTAAERAGVPHETMTDHALDTTLASVLSMHARYADLVVLGQVNPHQPPPFGQNLPEEVVLSCGRPALIVPYAWTRESLGERVLVGWDASREAARAVHDAMPLLERAGSVLVVSVRRKGAPRGEGELPGGDIGTHLARCQVKVEVQEIEADGMDNGEALLAFADDHGCDLLVMGAYAHSRLRQLVLGGATRTVFQKMTLPVLMAH